MTTTPIDNTSITTDFNVDELTEGTLTGKGVFDVLLQTLRLHLDREFTSNRITGTAYATVYSQAITAFLAQATQYALAKAKLPLELQLLQEQISLTQKQQEQIIAETSRVLYEVNYKLPEEVTLIKRNQDQAIAQTNKVTTDTVVTIKQGHLTDAQTCQVRAETNQVNAVVATKLPKEVAQIEAQTSLLAYDLTNIKPTEKSNLISTGLRTDAETSQIVYKTTTILPEELEILKRNQIQLTAQTGEINYRVSTLLPSQTAQNTAQTSQITYTTSYVLPSQVALTNAQKDSADAQTALYAQKTVTEQAQATNAPAATSVMGVQNALMEQQKNQMLRDGEQKAAKIMLDTWQAIFTTDQSLTEPDAVNKLRDEEIGAAVTKLLQGVGAI